MLGHWWKGTLGPPQLVLMLGPQLGPGCTWCVTAGQRWAPWKDRVGETQYGSLIAHLLTPSPELDTLCILTHVILPTPQEVLKETKVY